MTPRLITIPFSHYCEKARWALDRRGIAFVEEAHLPVLHTRATRAVGGRSTPLLVIDDGGQQRALTDSTDILHYADTAGTRGERLFPDADSAVAGEVAALEDRFDEVLGPHARRLGYFFGASRRSIRTSSSSTTRQPCGASSRGRPYRSSSGRWPCRRCHW